MSNDANADQAAKLTMLEALVVATANPSLCARAVKQCAGSAYRLGMLTAAVPIVVSLCYAIVVSEPLWQRMMTVVVLGLVPSSIVLMTGALVGAILAMVSMFVDPANTTFRRLMPLLGRAVLAGSAYGLGIALTVMLRVTKWIGSLIGETWHAWEDVCWAGCQRARTAAHAWRTVSAPAVVCCARRSILLLLLLRLARAAIAFTASYWSGAAFKVLVFGLRAIADKLDALGCMINAIGSVMWMAATFPIRLVAGVLLQLTQNRAVR